MIDRELFAQIDLLRNEITRRLGFKPTFAQASAYYAKLNNPLNNGSIKVKIKGRNVTIEKQ
jgi:hypothetical protein